MRVFVLEDDPARMLWLRERLAAHDVTHAESCAHAGRYRPPYDLVLLDHDLGGRQLEDHPDNGEQFAKAVLPAVAAPGMAPRAFVVHSYNADGARNIAAVLRPFARHVLLAPFRGPFFLAVLDRFDKEFP